jgi:hypothetical protein
LEAGLDEHLGYPKHAVEGNNLFLRAERAVSSVRGTIRAFASSSSTQPRMAKQIQVAMRSEYPRRGFGRPYKPIVSAGYQRPGSPGGGPLISGT